MLLSVCIPIYNADVRHLAQALNDQIKQFPSEVELLFIDDASDDVWRIKNSIISEYCSLLELRENIGRSRVRNAFLSLAEGKYLLFIDGDSSLISSDFIEKYVVHLRKENPQVLIGASVYAIEKPPKKQRLRWYYSRKRESKAFSERSQNPSLGFKSNNFIIQKEIFVKHMFDESLKTYGHEDTLFGFNLRKAGFIFMHIDNPVLNSNLDTNDVFLAKSKEAIQNLIAISKKLKDPDFDSEHKLYTFATRISENKWKRSLMKIVDYFFLDWITRQLIKGNVSLFLYDLYRLLHYLRFLSLN